MHARKQPPCEKPRPVSRLFSYLRARTTQIDELLGPQNTGQANTPPKALEPSGENPSSVYVAPNIKSRQRKETRMWIRIGEEILPSMARLPPLCTLPTTATANNGLVLASNSHAPQPQPAWSRHVYLHQINARGGKFSTCDSPQSDGNSPLLSAKV